MIEPDNISPSQVLDQVAAVLPAGVRDNLIVCGCGSLAAAYWFFAGDGNRAIRTKDIDGLCSPRAKSVAPATAITDRLLDTNWKPRGAPFSARQARNAPDGLPMVRLHPPEGSNCFLELMAAPPPYQPGSDAMKLQAIDTAHGTFALCSFDFLARAEWNPQTTRVGYQNCPPGDDGPGDHASSPDDHGHPHRGHDVETLERGPRPGAGSGPPDDRTGPACRD